MYLTYEEYIQMGGTLEETAFEELEFEARTQIDYWTFNRLSNDTTFPEAVKRCMYKLITLLNDQQQALAASIPATTDSTNAGIMSQSNDGVSITYNMLSAHEIVETVQDKIKTTINQYLTNVRNSLGRKVLYRGVYGNE